LSVIFLSGCGSTALSAATPTVEQATVTSVPSTTIPPFPTDTLTLEPSSTFTPEPSSTPVPSETPGLKIPVEFTLTPGIAATYAVFVARQTEMVGTAMAQVGPSAHLSGFLIFYSHPVGTPLSTWHDIPIMSQATAGQEFQSDIYSYTATATLDQANQYYSSKANSLNWSCFPPATGYGGTGSGANHSVTFMCQGFTIIITSFDNDTKQVLVVINKAS
jgi:hypothetical protein